MYLIRMDGNKRTEHHKYLFLFRLNYCIYLEHTVFYYKSVIVPMSDGFMPIS